MVPDFGPPLRANVLIRDTNMHNRRMKATPKQKKVQINIAQTRTVQILGAHMHRFQSHMGPNGLRRFQGVVPSCNWRVDNRNCGICRGGVNPGGVGVVCHSTLGRVHCRRGGQGVGLSRFHTFSLNSWKLGGFHEKYVFSWNQAGPDAGDLWKLICVKTSLTHKKRKRL